MTEAGVWIDHTKAVIAIVAGKNEELKRIESMPEDQRERRCKGHLNKYYDDVIACIRDTDAILIFGPGEAKIELEERLGHEAVRARVVGVKTAERMTDRQVAARVRQRFLQ
jgi:stalled ribosome rescue protein Dom34